MKTELDIRLRLSAQRALLTHVTHQMRAVSVEFDYEQRQIKARFIFDVEPSQSIRDVASCAAAEIIADFVDDWMISEEYLVCPVPNKMEHLRLLVYHRCEDEWVEDAF